MKAKYIKSFSEPIVTDDDGLIDNPIEEFITLNKLKSAKIAGHNNVDKDIKKVLNKLKSKNFIHKSKYEKLLEKLI
jgi:hypothetical protein